MPKGLTISTRGAVASVYLHGVCVLFRVTEQEAEAWVSDYAGGSR